MITESKQDRVERKIRAIEPKGKSYETTCANYERLKCLILNEIGKTKLDILEKWITMHIEVNGSNANNKRLRLHYMRIIHRKCHIKLGLHYSITIRKPGEMLHS